jgi:predicted flap endonuclease-1-like 5' DNA nuclease
MYGAVVFIAAFATFFGITIGIISLPPGEMIYTFLGSPEITYTLFGITGDTFFVGITNGVIWGSIITIIYSFGYNASKKEIILTPPITKTTHNSMQRSTSRSIATSKSKTYFPLNQSVEIIGGIGPKYGNRLRYSGVKIIEDLLKIGSTKNGRLHLAEKVDVAPSTIFKWVNRADFLRIKGIGKEYSSLLESAGVTTTNDLSGRNSWNLYYKLKETNKERNVGKRTPPHNTIEYWILSAKKLQPIVIY